MTRIQPRTAPARTVQRLIDSGVHPLLARVYAARGITRSDELDYGLKSLLPPEALRGTQEAAQLLADAIEAGARLLIVADYDCDGATACAVAVRALRAFGAEVGYLVPNRFEYGYGLTPAIVELAARQQPDVLITVDNGIASVEGVAAARSYGIATLITDHHLPGAELPEADVIVNPNQPGCDFTSKSIAGVGVIFYTMLALRAELRERGAFAAREEPRLADSRSRRARHGRRCRPPRSQQPHPRRPGAQTPSRRAHAGGDPGAFRRFRTRTGACNDFRPGLCTRAEAERRRADVRHEPRHRMPDHR
jgi:exonuclease RecJ (EC 3.1.-.-)